MHIVVIIPLVCARPCRNAHLAMSGFRECNLNTGYQAQGKDQATGGRVQAFIKLAARARLVKGTERQLAAIIMMISGTN